MKPNTTGFYGDYGGAFVPEMLYNNVDSLQHSYEEILDDSSFQIELQQLLQDYVGRPTPLYQSTYLSDLHKCSVYLKREDLCHTGAHKINNTLGQALLAKRMGKRRIIAETGAGQHGVATATACALLGLECLIYMGEKDMQRQASNVAKIKFLGAEIRGVNSGSMTLKDATNEAIRDWINNVKDTHYIIGSVVGPHPYPDLVTRLQAIISKEIASQLKGNPDYVFACVGGGSNAIGAFYHFLESNVKLVGVEASGYGIDTAFTAATLAKGTPGVLHASMTYMMQDEYGQVKEPHSISAGLDYPGIGPIHAYLKDTARVDYKNVTDDQALQAGVNLSRNEGIIPALESAHALAALDQFKFDRTDTVVVNLSGRGDKDMDTYTNRK